MDLRVKRDGEKYNIKELIITKKICKSYKKPVYFIHSFNPLHINYPMEVVSMAIKSGVNKEWMDTTGATPLSKVSHVKRKKLDIPYGSDELQKMDILLPEVGEGPFPLIIDVHGGGLMFCDKRDFHMYPMFYALEHGFAAACINYRLSPKVKCPEHVFDLKRAIAFLSEHAEEYKLDMNNVFLWGCSGGGYVVLNGAMKKWLPLPDEAKRAEEVKIRAVAALCPEVDPFDPLMGRGEKLSEYLMYYFFFKPFYLKNIISKEDLKNKNFDYLKTINYLKDGIAPVYLQHGDLDRTVPIRQSEEFYEKAKGLLGPEDLVLDVLPGVKHAGNGPAYFKEDVIVRILDFFKAHIVH